MLAPEQLARISTRNAPVNFRGILLKTAEDLAANLPDTSAETIVLNCVRSNMVNSYILLPELIGNMILRHTNEVKHQYTILPRLAELPLTGNEDRIHICFCEQFNRLAKEFIFPACGVRPDNLEKQTCPTSLPEANTNLKFIEEAYTILEATDTHLYELVEESVMLILLLRNPNDSPDNNMSFSCKYLPGMIALTAQHPLLAAETLVHETMHNILNLVQWSDPIINSNYTKLVKSPWRGDMRPLNGLVHAVFVFDAVVRFYEKLIDSNRTYEGNEASILKRRKLLSENLKMGLNELSMVNESAYTPYGKKFIDHFLAIF